MMLLERIYWEDGLLLDSDILDRSNLTILENSAFSNYLPFNLSRGIITFDIDTESLNSGLILVKDLKLYLQDKKIIFFNKKYPLSLQVSLDRVSEEIPLFLNVREKVLEEKGFKYIYNQLSLSLEYDHSMKYSTQVALFLLDNGKLVAKDYDFPLLTLDHYLMNDVFVRINRLVSELKAFNRFVFSTSRSYAAILLTFLINKFEKDLEFAEFIRLNSCPKQIFDLLHDIYSLIGSNLDNVEDFENIIFDFQKPIVKLRILVDKVLALCEYKKINNFVKFELHGQKYICDNFPEEFFVATKYYVIVKKKASVLSSSLKFDNKNALRITSISRNQNIVTLSLSGVRLLDVEHSMINFTFKIDNIDAIYEIQKGSELDFIIADRSATFSAFKESKNFDFYITFY